MAAETQSSLKIIEVCKVAPLADSVRESSSSSSGLADFCLPLTFFDMRYLLRYPPAELLFFYKLSAIESTPDVFHSKLVPKLKKSLSQALLYFLPLAGSIRWPPNSPRPMIVYTPGDWVSLIVAECHEDDQHRFDRFVETGVSLEVSETYPYVPELQPSDSKASSTSPMQITLFPNKGFCVGLSQHHAVVDARTIITFLKAWAYICKHGCQALPPELIPSFERSVIKDSYGLEAVYLNYWQSTMRRSTQKYTDYINPRSLKWVQPNKNIAGFPPNNNLVRSTFHLSSESIQKLRKNALSYYSHQELFKGREKPSKELHLSSFILVFAFVMVCLVKARGGSKNRKVLVMITLDCRGRFDLNIPLDYFGVCIGRQDAVMEAGDFMEDNGVAVISRRLSGMVKGMEKEEILGREKEILERWENAGSGLQKFRVAGSNRIGFYDVDFGWGRPERAMIPNIERTNTISLLESKEGSGGIEVGLVLTKHRMEAFFSLATKELNDSFSGNGNQSRL